jgi:uncharacterized membrane protein YidH (DUF202 family)
LHAIPPPLLPSLQPTSLLSDSHNPPKQTALERTYLAYLRTSLALAITGVTIAQLLRLTEGEAVGTWLATAFVGGSVVVVIAGAIRFWRQQMAMVKGKVLASGWEMGVIIVVAIAVSLFFVL